MIDKPDITKSQWATDDVIDLITGVNNKVEPLTIKKTNGWNRLEKPPREYDNYIKNQFYNWHQFVDQFFDVFYGQTTNATETELFLNEVTNSRLTVDNNSNITFEALINAILSDASQNKSWKIKGGIVRNNIILIPNQIIEIIFQNNWNISDAIYTTKNKDVSAQDATPYSVFIKPDDGTKMYMLGGTNDTVYQYTLSTPWDVSTATYDTKNKSVTTEADIPVSIDFKPDGTKMYITDQFTNTVYQYTLSTPWDVSTATYDTKSKDVSAQESNLRSIRLKPDDGTKMYTYGTGNISYQYTLSTAWDISTATYDTKSGNFSGTVSGTGRDIFFRPDGSKCYVLEETNGLIYQFSLTTLWDISTITYDSKNFDTSTQDATPRGIFFRNNGVDLYTAGDTNDTIFQYELNLSWDVIFEADTTNNALVPKVTGETSKTINWKIKLEKLVNKL